MLNIFTWNFALKSHLIVIRFFRHKHDKMKTCFDVKTVGGVGTILNNDTTNTTTLSTLIQRHNWRSFVRSIKRCFVDDALARARESGISSILIDISTNTAPHKRFHLSTPVRNKKVFTTYWMNALAYSRYPRLTEAF